MLPLDAVRNFLQDGIRNCSVTCALSGGADSVCLLYCLRELAEEFALEVKALHVQHNLREAESLRDEQFCRELCRKWQIPLQVVSVHVRERAAKEKLSLETAARECRYAAFEQVQGYVATAHTASDQLETVLFRLVRGSGLRGLCGIPPRRDRYLRPLLRVTRVEIETFLLEQKIAFVTDSSNLSDAFSRNRLRHQVIPVLKQLNPAAEAAVCRMTETLREDCMFLEKLADEAFRQCQQADGSLRGLDTLPVPVRKRCIARFLEENGFPHSFPHLSTVEKLFTSGGKIDLDRSGTLICYSHGVLYLEQKQPQIPCCMLQLGENSIFPGYSVDAAIISRTDSEKFRSVHKKFTDSALDYDIIKEYAVLHARRPGLRLRPDGREHHVSVKKWLNASVPPSERRYLHFLSDAEGLLWVQGLGIADRAAVTAATERILLLTVRTAG